MLFGRKPVPEHAQPLNGDDSRSLRQRVEELADDVEHLSARFNTLSARVTTQLRRVDRTLRELEDYQSDVAQINDEPDALELGEE
jgi:uncharacterized protein YlxW (UPF0749 family)